MLKTKQKVYQGVLQQIRSYIETNQLSPGDKLPSERELAVKLNAGRSSVREALRALELLGIIETRTGEGTFLRSYRTFQTVELIASFVLNDSITKKDLKMTKRILEKEAAKLAYNNIEDNDIATMERIIEDNKIDEYERKHTFFSLLFEKTENMMLFHIWKLMEEYSHSIETELYEIDFYRKLIQCYRNNHYSSIEPLFFIEG